MKTFLLMLCLVVLFAVPAQAEIGASASYFFTMADGTKDGILYEANYQKDLGPVIGELGVGFMNLEIRSVDGMRREDLRAIPIRLGVKYRLLKYLSIRAGGDYTDFHLDTCSVPGEFGGYAGIELANEHWFINVTRKWCDLDIDYAIVENASNVSGTLVGAGYRFGW